MNRLRLLVGFSVCFVPLTLSCAGEAPVEKGTTAVNLVGDEDKTLYSLGVAMSQNLAPLGFGEKELALIQAGLADGVLGRDPRVPLEEFGPRIQGMLQERVANLSKKEKEAGTAFRAEVAKEPGAETMPSGLVYRVLKAGDGAQPGPKDTVKIHYVGTLRDGLEFDRSPENEPVTFPLDGVISCFSEGLQKMKVGGKSKLTCPPEIAYSDRGAPPKIRPGATLVFEIELLVINPKEEPAAETPSP